MNIQRVYVDGFKNLSNINLILDDITALISINNYGKSNVIKAIYFGFEFIKKKNNERKLLLSDSNLIPINICKTNTPYKFEVEARVSVDKVAKYFVYGYVCKWNNGYEPEILSEYLKIKQEGKGQKYTQVLIRDSDKAFYKSSETGRCTTELKIESLELSINKMQAFDNLYYHDIIKGINDLKIYMESDLDADYYFLPDPIINKNESEIEINSSNLPRLIYNLKNYDKRKFSLLKNAFCVLFPSIEDIIVKQFRIENETNMLQENSPFSFANAIYVLFVKDKNLLHPINFSLMSDGAKRVFMIMTKILVASSSHVSLITLEEPENSVHPGLFRDYIQTISGILDDCKVIITSHSPYVISYLDPQKVYVGVSDKPGVAEFHSFTKSGIKALEEDSSTLKISMGDYLFSMLADESNEWTNYLEC